MASHALLAGVLSSLFFVTLNVAMNIYMKWLFCPEGGDFALPWTMLAVQQLQAYLVLQPWIARSDPLQCWGWNMTSKGNGDDDEKAAWMNMMQVLAVTALFCVNVGLNSLSLVRISITLNQTVRAFLPVGVLLLASCLEQRAYPSHSYVTTAILVVGIALTCWGSPDFEFYGFCLAFASTLMAALGTSLNGRLLSKGPFSRAGPYGIARLMMIQSVPAFFMFGLIAAMTEGSAVWAKLTDGSGRWQWYHMVGLVSVSSALALLSNLGRCFLVAATSALMETLAGNAKVAALCVIDHYLFGTALFVYNYIGISLTFAGFSIHVLLQYASKDPAPQDTAVKDKTSYKPSTMRVQVQGSEVAGHQTTMRTRRQTMTRPRLISAAETGLACEHVALELRQPALTPALSFDSEAELLPRPRSQTWPPVSPTASPGASWMDVDLYRLIEVPRWLNSTASTQTLEEQEYSPVEGSVPGSSPTRRASMPTSPTKGGRSRFHTEPAVPLNKAILMDGQDSQPVLNSVPEEDVDEEPQEEKFGYL